MPSPSTSARRARVLCLVVLAVSVTSLLAVVPAHASSPYCTSESYMLSFPAAGPGGLIVADERSNTGVTKGVLRARTSAGDVLHSATSWERWRIVCSGSYVALKNSVGSYVSVEDNSDPDYGWMLRARGVTTIGTWEKFTLASTSNGYMSLKSAANGRFVTAEVTYPGKLDGILRARATKVGSWESFDLLDFWF